MDLIIFIFNHMDLLNLSNNSYMYMTKGENNAIYKMYTIHIESFRKLPLMPVLGRSIGMSVTLRCSLSFQYITSTSVYYSTYVFTGVHAH